MKILKFGGSSLSTAERVKQVINIIQKEFHRSQEIAVVVSAFGGVTDELITISQHAANGNEDYPLALTHLKQRHLTMAEQLVQNPALETLHHTINQHFKELKDTLHGAFLVRELSKRTLDFIMSFGERLSACIISEAMKAQFPTALFMDARQFIKTDRNFGAARVNYTQTNALIQKAFSHPFHLPIVTGFIGSTDQQDTTTLGRGGSDFTASILGAALNAQEIEIWTDVDGVMTADPRKVQQAYSIPQMSYKEALEMSHFGAKVIHPPTITPALLQKIPLRIKNTFHPDAEGTLISGTPRNHESIICGISSIDTIALVRVEGSGIVGVSGMAMRLFGALAKKEINVILISQGSSEHSICFAIVPQATDIAKEALEEEFSLDRQAGFIDPIIVEEDLSIIAIVGENMRRTAGISGRLFGVLGKNGINIVAIAQGSSEYNISVVVSKQDETKALNVIHEEFFLSHTTTLHLFLVGTGLIGSTLLSQIHKQLPILRKNEAIELKVVGLADSQKMAFNPKGFTLENWKTHLQTSSEPMNIGAYLQKMKHFNLMNSIFIDCTADQAIADAYPAILESNISIVTPNKKANSGNYIDYKKLKEICRKKEVTFLYETNVGAGLPIISTINDLLKSGDKILKIEAILSGTLSYLFNAFAKGKSFSESLKEAQQKGFTEPDPREDLSGNDVLRKLLILARESGHAMEFKEISKEPLLPPDCFKGSLEDFYHQLKEFDVQFDEKRTEAAKKNQVLRYIATLDQGKASIVLKAVDQQHPFYHLSGSDNIIAITTERYKDTPLVIKGQGAGAEVTAGEVFADIIRIGRS